MIYARHTMVYIIGIYQGILNDICIRIYHGIHHNIFSSFISHSILVHSSLPIAALFTSTLQRLNCSLASFSQSLPTPLLSFFHSDLAKLPQPITPHPEVELTELPASVASPHLESEVAPAFSPKQWGRVGCVFPLIQQGISGTRPSTFSALQIYRLSRLVLLAGSKNIGTPLLCMSELGVKGAEEDERELSMSFFILQLPDWSNCTVEEKLWPSIPQKAFSAAEIHVCFDIELVCCPWTIWIWGHQADTVLPIVGKDQIHILMYTIVYSMIYTMIYTMKYTMICIMVYIIVYSIVYTIL
jgi:hypothetical protein